MEQIKSFLSDSAEGVKKIMSEQFNAVAEVFKTQFQGLFESLGYKGNSENAAGANDKLKGMSSAASKAGKNPPAFPSMG